MKAYLKTSLQTYIKRFIFSFKSSIQIVKLLIKKIINK